MECNSSCKELSSPVLGLSSLGGNLNVPSCLPFWKATFSIGHQSNWGLMEKWSRKPNILHKQAIIFNSTIKKLQKSLRDNQLIISNKYLFWNLNILIDHKRYENKLADVDLSGWRSTSLMSGPTRNHQMACTTHIMWSLYRHPHTMTRSSMVR